MEVIWEIKFQLGREFERKNLETSKKIAGSGNNEKSRGWGSILSQKGYINRILSKVIMNEVILESTPNFCRLKPSSNFFTKNVN